MSAPHPTIPGVSVVHCTSWRRVLLFDGQETTEIEAYPRFNSISIKTLPHRPENTNFHAIHPADAETVCSMIRDQAAWLSEQDTDR